MVGESWSHINHIAVSSAGVVLAATSDNNHNGFIYRSVDGGQTWGLFPVYTGSKVGPRNMVYKVVSILIIRIPRSSWIPCQCHTFSRWRRELDGREEIFYLQIILWLKI